MQGTPIGKNYWGLGKTSKNHSIRKTVYWFSPYFFLQTLLDHHSIHFLVSDSLFIFLSDSTNLRFFYLLISVGWHIHCQEGRNDKSRFGAENRREFIQRENDMKRLDGWGCLYSYKLDTSSQVLYPPERSSIQIVLKRRFVPWTWCKLEHNRVFHHVDSSLHIPMKISKRSSVKWKPHSPPGVFKRNGDGSFVQNDSLLGTLCKARGSF